MFRNIRCFAGVILKTIFEGFLGRILEGSISAIPWGVFPEESVKILLEKVPEEIPGEI